MGQGILLPGGPRNVARPAGGGTTHPLVHCGESDRTRPGQHHLLHRPCWQRSLRPNTAGLVFLRATKVTETLRLGSCLACMPKLPHAGRLSRPRPSPQPPVGGPGGPDSPPPSKGPAAVRGPSLRAAHQTAPSRRLGSRRRSPRRRGPPRSQLRRPRRRTTTGPTPRALGPARPTVGACWQKPAYDCPTTSDQPDPALPSTTSSTPPYQPAPPDASPTARP